MAKPPKPNTLAEVSRRVAKLAYTLRTIDELTSSDGAKNGPHSLSLIDTASWSLLQMFAAYGIALPSLDQEESGTRRGPESAISPSEHGKLGAVEGVSRLLSKVALLTHDVHGYDPKDYVTGIVQLLSGLPLEQLSSTPDRLRTGFDGLTIRDMVSDLLTADRSSGYAHPFMLYLLHPERVGMLTTPRTDNQAHYVTFLREALSYVNELNINGRSPTYEAFENEVKEVYAETARQLQTPLAAVNGRAATTIIAPSVLESLCRTPDFKQALEQHLGGRVVALSLAGGRKGRNPTVVVHYRNGEGNGMRATIDYGTSRAPLAVVDALQALQAVCQSSLTPASPLYLPNAAVAIGTRFMDHR